MHQGLHPHQLFEKTLPDGFREKLMAVMGGPAGMASAMGSMGNPGPGATIDVTPPGTQESFSSADMDLHQARITILRAVAVGNMTPEEAEVLLFPNG